MVSFEWQILRYLTGILDLALAMMADMETILVGDFNDFYVDDLTSDHNLVKMVHEPTRKSSISDIIFLSENLLFDYKNAPAISPPLSNSDNNTVLLQSSKCLNSSTRTVPVCDLSQSYLNADLCALEKIDFEAVNDCDDVNDMYAVSYSLLSKAISCIPVRYIRLSDKLWITLN